MDMMEFNEKLQQLRKQKGLTQEALADALFVSRTAVSKWESGRGYPNIESLKTIAKFFGVTIDDLLSGDELLNLAQEDTIQKQQHIRDLLFGLLDCSAVMFFFLPLFGQKVNGVVQAVSLLSLTEISAYLRICYFAVVIGMLSIGICTLALQNWQNAFWMRNKSKIALVCSIAGAFLFIISSQPYAATFMFSFLVIKAIMLMKWQ